MEAKCEKKNEHGYMLQKKHCAVNMMTFIYGYCDEQLCNNPKDYRCELEAEECAINAFRVAGNKTIEVDGNSTSTMMPSNGAENVVLERMVSITALMFSLPMILYSGVESMSYPSSIIEN